MTLSRFRLNVLPDNPEKEESSSACGLGRFPSWLHRKIEKGNLIAETDKAIQRRGLKTVCEEAFCPNITDCWGRKSATFLVLGKECTRSCGFCAVSFSKAPPLPLQDEGEKVVESILELGLRHVVLTMPARDDLPDGGAVALQKIVEAIQASTSSSIELLTSDFLGNKNSWQLLSQIKMAIFNHNIETVARLTPQVRHKATFDRSLALLDFMRKEAASRPKIKSGFMVGLGETALEIEETLKTLADHKVDIVTIGQYLQSDSRKLRVKSFVPPDQFAHFATLGKKMGIPQVLASPFMRSSYTQTD